MPGNAAPFEIAVTEAMTDVLPVPIREIMDPATAPAAFLPFLAAHESVDLWFEDWSDDRKRAMIAQALQLAALKGTPAASQAFLDFVDGQILDKISYPSRFVLGRSAIGRHPIGHPAFVARHLVKVETFKPPRALVAGRSVLGRAVLRTPSRERIRRCRVALTVAKAPDTEYRADFAHGRKIRLDDAVPLDGTYRIGQYLDRVKL
nr:phage tail protein I [Aurantimonas sp. DM33-3]